MQFIKNGPDIPDRLLQEHEDGRVVFFCGAGISYPAGLPGFRGLVNKLYEAIGEIPSSVEKTAIKKEQYDTAIGLLEGRIADGRATVRKQVANILRPDLSKSNATATHNALLGLARNRQGRYRLITTNFDRLFEEAAKQSVLSVQTFQAPRLPVPKNRWDGLVYLHGLLPETPTNDELNDLVISSGDFGLAYLSERWAARFVSELFRNYVICFVGYSINDPVLRYMMDALAADKLLGESPREVFAFGSYQKGQEVEKADEWRAKNVIPILYREYSGHRYLHRTLQEWANTYRDGVLGKERIVELYAITKPLSSTKQDDFVGRMLWSLSDKRALPAKRFAEFNPLPSLDWLVPLSETRFRHHDLPRFGIQPNTSVDDTLSFSLLSRPTPYALASRMVLVNYGHSGFSQWDDVMFQLSRWLIRYLDEPDLIFWIAKHGNMLHTQFASLISKELQDHPPSSSMQTLWRIILSGRLQNQLSHFDFYDWCKNLEREGLTPLLRFQLRDILTPCVRLKEPFRYLEYDDESKDGELRGVKDLVDWEIALNTEDIHWVLKEVAHNVEWIKALPELLSDVTTLLRDTLDLMHELGGADELEDGSYLHQPSISEHPQNQNYRDWTALINLVRDSWIETAERFPIRARLEVDHWLNIRYPLFRRLVFFAAANSSLITPQEALGWLLEDDHWWLWSIETQRETLRLLVTVATRLESQNREALEWAILLGPPPKMFVENIESESLQQIVDREIWLRLAKINKAGFSLGIDAGAKLQSLSLQYPAWSLAHDESDEFPVWMGDDEDWRTFLATPKSFRNLVDWLREHSKKDTWKDDDWRERCKIDLRRTAIALRRLTLENTWLNDRWREALQAWSDEALTKRSWHYVGAVLADAPNEFIKEIAHSLSWWLQSIAKTFEEKEDIFFALIRRVLRLYHEDTIESDPDPVSKAINHPIGHIMEALLRWWYRRELQDNQLLMEPLKSIFSEICDIGVSIFRHGRILLATHVVALFRVDREWTVRHVLPLFDWDLSEFEARSAWQGFLWSPRLYRDLMETIKLNFLATARHYTELGQYKEQYAALLTFASLEPGDVFNKKELVVATRSLPQNGLEHVAEALVRALERAGGQHAEYWRNRIRPYLKTIWPKDKSIITAPIAASFARLCIAAGDAFPDAVQELTPWLKPSEDPDFSVHLLSEAKLCDRFPLEALTFLDVVVNDASRWLPRDLEHCLDAIRNAREGIDNNDKFRRLADYLRQRPRYT